MFSQDITLDWVEHLGTTYYDSPAKMIVDYSGNIYTSGKLKDTIDFDPGPGVHNLQPHLNEDLYIRKLDSEGNFDWVKPFKNLNYSEDSRIRDLGTDTLRNIYVSGSLNGFIDFDPGPDTLTLESDGYSGIDGFIVKLDSNGNLTWAKKIGGLWDLNVEAMHVDQGGDMYLTGFFRGTVDFDPGAGVFNMTSTTYGNNFILKLDTNGDLVWAKQIGENQYEDFYITDLINDESGNLFISGHFSGTYDLDPGPDVVNLTTLFTNSFEHFLLKLDSIGEFVWVKSYRGAYQEVSTTLAIDKSNNLLIAGSYGGTVDFDFGPDAYELTSTYSVNAYTLKLNLDGEFIWVKHIDGLQCNSCSSRSRSVAVNTDQFNNVYTTGYFQNHIDIDSGEDSLIFHSEGTNTSYEDIYIQKLDSNGGFMWGGQIGGPLRERTNSIDLDYQNDILTFGWFYDTIDFDPGVNEYDLESIGGSDVFLQKLTQCNSPLIPDSATLPVIYGICNVQPDPPTASSNCIEGLNGIANTPWPILDESITEIIWTYNDGYGNTATQTQTIIWSDLDISTSQYGFTITANNINATYQWLNCDTNYTPIIGDTNVNFTATTTGSYAVEITQDGCIDTSTCIILECTGITLDTSTSLNGFTITANNTNATYQWLNCDNNSPIVGETNAVFNAENIGNYAVEISQGGCVDTSACISIECANITLDTSTDLNGFTISANNTNATYQWLNCDNNSPMVGETNAVFNAENIGNYAIEISQGGCIDTSACISIECANITLDTSTTLNGLTITANNTNATYQWLNCDNNSPIVGETNAVFTAENIGNYAVEISQGGCIDTSACIFIECSEFILDISTTINGLTITANNTNATYQWLDCDNNNISIIGDTNADYTATANGNYAVEITENGCVDTSACVSITGIGLDELNTLSLAVYPNPFTDVFNITFEKAVEQAWLNVSNTLGQLVYKTEIKQTSKTSINLKDKPSGIYYLTIISQNQQKTIELIKE